MLSLIVMILAIFLRGEEHLSNTPKQLQIYEYFGWEPPKFGHMTIIVNPNGKKLSKRDHDILQFMSQYRDLGYVPEAIFNFLFLLGWTSEDNREIFTKEEAIKAFDPSRLSSSPSMFDNKRLLWTNQYYIKHMDNEKYFEFIMPFVKKASVPSNLNDNQLKSISLIFKNEIEIGQNITDMLNDIFVKKTDYDEEEMAILNSESAKVVIPLFKEKLEKLDVINQDTVKNIFKEIQKETGFKGKDLYMPIRIKLTGSMHGIEMFNIIDILGKEETLSRLI